MVELKNVSFSYGKQESDDIYENSLSDINITIQTGEFVLLTGPSGCGKTTILRLINGLVPQFYPGKVSGEVLIDGNDISDNELYDTAHKVGTVFQNPRSQFYNVDTTGELAFGCENRALPEPEIYERIDKTVSSFGIEPLMDRNIFKLSDGEKQKIACASVDVSDTDIILLDEPSANLDYEATLALRNMIIKWKEKKKTIIVAEHRIAYLWDLIDRALIMWDGRIIKEITAKEKDELSSADVRAMGLRSLSMENPSEIDIPAVTDSDEIIKINGLRFSYKDDKKGVVDIPEMSVAAGQITAVTGSNGAGKTSLLNCLCGLEKRCKGTIEYKGRSYKNKDRRKLMFMVMQDTGNQLFTDSVLDEVVISLPKDVSDHEKAATDLLRELDLGDYKDRHPQSLSGGQKQRLAIACAIASGRKILLFDEPTSGLDYDHMDETAQLLKRLKERGTTVIVVTHDSELIRKCCDRKICC